MPEGEAARLREAGEEYGATTGRPRRCGWLDLPALRYAARINGFDDLVVTKLDVLDDFDEIRVLEAYQIDGVRIDAFPNSAAGFTHIRPEWRSFKGWKAETSAARRWSDLPQLAREYLEWVERAVGVRISSVSVGAERDAEVPRA